MSKRRKSTQNSLYRTGLFEQLEDRRLLAGLTADANEIFHHGRAEIPNGSVPAIEGAAVSRDQFGNALAVGDFNGDTFPDLAVGATKYDHVAHPEEGEDSVNILYGSSSGLTTDGNQIWDQDSPGIDDVKEAGDRFGQALVAGDLNGDGYDDLVIGAPGEDLSGAVDAGLVHVLLGSEEGLTAAGSRTIELTSTGGEWGRALAIGDMNNNGVLDLAIGRPGAFNSEGQVAIYYDGAATGIGQNSIAFQQFGGGSGREDGDRFGFSLAMGDFDRDGFADLAVGVPGENTEGIVFDEIDTGAVNIFRGAPSGFSGDGLQFWNQDSSGIIDSTGDFNQFGYSLVVGDFDGDLADDLAIGVPGETEGGESHAGAVNIIYGSPGSGLTSQGNEYLHQDSPRIAGLPEFNDLFGKSLAAGDFNGDFRDDLIVGVPREDTDLTDVGAFHVIPGTPSGLQPASNAPLVEVTLEDTAGLNGAQSSGAFFATAIAAADFDQDGKADLAIGVPGKWRMDNGINFAESGIVHTIYGTAGAFQTAANPIWQQGDGENESDLQSSANFGTAVASGDFNGDGYADMVTGIPFRHLPIEQRWSKFSAGAVNVVYSDADGLNTNTAEVWTQDRLRHPNSNDATRGAESADLFGSSLAAGDFNNDGFDDLAIGSPGENLAGKTNVGMVNIVFGSDEGLTAAIDLTNFFAARNQFLWQGDPEIDDFADAFDEFGRSLTVGDFDDDGFDDLAVGVPGEEINAQPGRDSGAVQVFYGGASGFHNGVDGHIRDQLWTVNTANIDVLMREEEFGTSLAAGDFDGDGVDDLAIGAPDSIPIFPLANEGLVGIMYGGRLGGLSANGNHGLFGFGNTFNPQNQFGFSLAAGDINGDGRDDLVVGAPFDDFPGSPPLGDKIDAGTVNVYHGAIDGLAHNTFDVWSQSNNGGPASAHGVAQAGDQFGYSLTMGDFDGDGFDDLVIGVPEGGTASQLGEANVIHGSFSGLDAARQQVWSQDSSGMLDAADTGDQFATALASGDFNRDGAADLLVGVRFEDVVGVTNAGLVHAIYGEEDSTAVGDFDGDGILGGTDIDALSAVAASGMHDLQFDLTGDALVNGADVNFWVTQLKGTMLGDANLDFVVDGADFVLWNSHKFTQDARWTHGNFNANSVIDGADFVVWNANKFTLTLDSEAMDERDREEEWPTMVDQLFATS